MIITVTLNPAVDKTVYVDKFKYGEVNKVEKSIVHPGGKGINVSKVLKNLDNPTISMGFLGGSNGEIIKEGLKELGIEGMFTPVHANTRVNIKIIDNLTGDTTSLNDRGDFIQDKELEVFVNDFKRKIHRGDFVVLSGSSPRGIPLDIYHTLSQYAMEVGAKVILDTSGELLKEALKSKLFLIKPNVEELEEALGLKLDSQKKIVKECKKLIDGGVDYICLSMGSQGAMFIGKDFILKTEVPRVIVKSTVGAGDSLLGGLVSYFDKGYSIEEAFKGGVAASVVAVTKEGTKAPSLSEINIMMDKIEIIKEEI